MAGASAWSFFQMLRSYKVTTLFRDSDGFIAFYMSITVLLLWLLVLVANGRRGGFIGIILLLGVTLASALFFGRAASVVPYFAVWAYCVARLFGLLGPRATRNV